jgi:hypothetical protein
MPGRAKLKRAGAVLPLVAAALWVAGCASSDHSWRGEFDARLEGAKAAIEERAGQFRPDSTGAELFDAGMELGPRLEFKGELIRAMTPPDGCEGRQEKGRRGVEDIAQLSYSIFKNLTPRLHRSLPGPLEEAIEESPGRCPLPPLRPPRIDHPGVGRKIRV